MNRRLLERLLALGAVALLAALVGLALQRATEPGPSSPPPVVAPPVAGRWYEAAVGTYGPGLFGRTTDCQVRLTRATRGVAHPVLPCGARIVVSYGGREVDTRVIDKGPYGAGVRAHAGPRRRPRPHRRSDRPLAVLRSAVD